MAINFLNNPRVGDNVKIEIGNSADLTIFHDGNSIIRNTVGDLYIDNYADDKDIIFRSDDGSGSQTAYITINGTTGENVFYKNVALRDGVKATFGNGNDLQIYHDGSNSYISDVGTGELLIRSNLVAIQNASGTENMAKFDDDAGVKLFYDDSQKFETTSAGVTVSGDVTINNSSGDFGAEAILKGTTSTGTPKSEIAFKRGTSGDGATMVLRTSNSSGTIQDALTLDTSRNANFAGNVAVKDGVNFYGANDTAASSENSNYVASFGKSTSGSAKFAGNITVGSGTSTFSGDVTISSASAPILRLTNTTSSQSWIQYVGSNDDFIIRDETDARSPLIINGSGDSTFAGSATIRKSSLGGSTPMADGTLVLGAGTTDYFSFRLDSGADLYFDKSYGGVAANVFSIDRSSTNGNITFAGDVGLGGTGLYTASHSLNIDGTGLAIKNDTNGSSNNWSTIKNTDTGSNSNLVFNSGLGTALTLNHNKSATFSGTVLIDGVSNYTGLEVKGTGSSRPAVNLSNATTGILGQVYATENSDLVLATTTSGTTALTLDSSQNATFAGDVGLADDKKLTFGAGPDFEISHNGTTNQNKITSLLGRQLLINTNSFVLNNAGDTENILTAAADGSVNLFYNGSQHFRTVSAGVEVTGDMLIQDTSPQITLLDTTNNTDALIYSDDTGSLNISADENNEQASSAIKLFVDGGEKMRITSSGGLNIGTGSNVASATQGGASFQNDSNDRKILLLSTQTTSANGLAIFYNPNGAVGTITTSGTSTAFNTSSDYRLKENVVDMTGALDRVAQLKPSRFNFIADSDTTVDGFLAHEVQSVVPEAITGTKDAVDEEGNPEYQGIDQSKLVPLLVGAIQELRAEIELLKNK